jgi:hypothetical protein
VVVAKGVQRTLDELNTKPPALYPSPSIVVDEDSTPRKVMWNIPYRRNPFFTGREELLKQLHDNLAETKAAALTQAQAISGLVLRSLKAIGKEAAIVTVILGRPTPDPRVGAPVELSGRDARGLLNFISVGKTLSRKRIAAEEPPPAFLEVQPAGSFRDEDVVKVGMLCQPGASLGAIVARKIVGDDEDIAHRIISFNISQQGNVVGRVA